MRLCQCEMSSHQELTQCIHWIAELLRQHTKTPDDYPAELTSPDEAWIRVPFAPHRIGMRLAPEAQSLTVMACGLALAPPEPGNAHLDVMPGGHRHQHLLEPLYFDGQLYGAWMPINGTALLGVQLRDEDLKASECPTALREWFDAAVRLLK